MEAAAAVRVAEAELARLVEQQRFLTVRAPFDAVISARNFDRGDLVRGDAAPADRWLYQLNRLDTPRFVISATPDLALKLTPDSRATVRFKEFPGPEILVGVAHSSELFDAASGTMRTELLLQSQDLAIPAGLTGTASFQLDPTDRTYLVPSNALILRQGVSLVATVVKNKAHFLEVDPGRNFGRNVEVTSNQFADTTVVILNANALLREGDAITPAPLVTKTLNVLAK